MTGKLIKQVWQRYPALYVILLCSGLLIGFADAGERARPFRIGALTPSWGPSPQGVGLRDGLEELGYREHEHFTIGVRFIELVEKAVKTQEEAQVTLAHFRRGEVEGIIKPPSVSLNMPGIILETAVQQGIPTMFDAAGLWVEQGGLAGYGPDFHTSGQQAARLVDKILKGTKPAEMPVEVNPKIEFAINLKVAKALGLTITPQVLYQADRLIR
jgi:hypothetical protein